ncbi:hypothetical protein OF829_18515 [Sphingomonas sp. LB-2]|uniref:hypothetical protein n=1 Tax=Sphingomonas caeni TaxID=2984949 RepID=UPI002230DBE0|nr:hypothetical protein [Sphingomonas caeni]MCW3849236.1 hypothetical protein [Sphingomonas caeni]
MLAYLLIPFGVFFACVVALGVEKGRIIGMIDKSDPDEMDRLGGWFVDGRRLRDVDAEPGTPLARRLRVYNGLWFLALCAGLAIPLTLVFVVPH